MDTGAKLDAEPAVVLPALLDQDEEEEKEMLWSVVNNNTVMLNALLMHLGLLPIDSADKASVEVLQRLTKLAKRSASRNSRLSHSLSSKDASEKKNDKNGVKKFIADGDSSQKVAQKKASATCKKKPGHQEKEHMYASDSSSNIEASISHRSSSISPGPVTMANPAEVSAAVNTSDAAEIKEACSSVKRDVNSVLGLTTSDQPATPSFRDPLTIASSVSGDSGEESQNYLRKPAIKSCESVPGSPKVSEQPQKPSRSRSTVESLDSRDESQKPRIKHSSKEREVSPISPQASESHKVGSCPESTVMVLKPAEGPQKKSLQQSINDRDDASSLPKASVSTKSSCPQPVAQNSESDESTDEPRKRRKGSVKSRGSAPVSPEASKQSAKVSSRSRLTPVGSASDENSDIFRKKSKHSVKNRRASRVSPKVEQPVKSATRPRSAAVSSESDDSDDESQDERLQLLLKNRMRNRPSLQKRKLSHSESDKKLSGISSKRKKFEEKQVLKKLPKVLVKDESGKYTKEREFLLSLKVGDHLCLFNNQDSWERGAVLNVNREHAAVFVHWHCYSEKYDEWLLPHIIDRDTIDHWPDYLNDTRRRKISDSEMAQWILDRSEDEDS